jgi:hypothetical protein
VRYQATIRLYPLFASATVALMNETYRGILVAQGLLPEQRKHVPKGRARGNRQQCSMRQSATVPRSCLILTHHSCYTRRQVQRQTQICDNKRSVLFIYMSQFFLSRPCDHGQFLSPHPPRSYCRRVRGCRGRGLFAGNRVPQRSEEPIQTWSI